MSDIAAAFDYAGDLGVPIVNASLGGGVRDAYSRPSSPRTPNTLYVVAAGNDNDDDDIPTAASYPCALPEDNILCVGATDQHDDQRA